ncbi:SoxR reducing system RseC family protein [Marinisporobacter balticus]|uniref:RseC/MucC-like positive regulator of sigma(E) n=1 Tax=Marinisporobacter balticus TaxID=2018667 RepID=A0A4R2KYB8_9FIRM|nr:SoxR reducing system RseC family protein [Marinisporobacter balticus]TCO79034.1 RseC/MucC-like positive regulator of sigma(E) [Marinisporobacter balticus]
MIQEGKVIEVLDHKRAKILMKKHAACGECGACQYGQENMSLNMIATNELNAEVGDMVEVNMETQNVLGAAFIAYGIPLFALVLGIGVGSFLLKKIGFTENIEMYAIGIGFLLTGISYVMIKMNEESFKNDKKYMPVISKILDK